MRRCGWWGVSKRERRLTGWYHILPSYGAWMVALLTQTRHDIATRPPFSSTVGLGVILYLCSVTESRLILSITASPVPHTKVPTIATLQLSIMTVISSSSDASPAPPTLYRGTESMHICLTLPPLTPPEEFPECPTVTAKYPAKTHARSVASRLPTKYGLIYLEGMPLQTFEDSDMSPKFRQRRGFLYMSGVVDIPDCKLVYTIETDCLTLYIPPLDPNAVLWTGMPLGLEECLKK